MSFYTDAVGRWEVGQVRLAQFNLHSTTLGNVYGILDGLGNILK